MPSLAAHLDANGDTKWEAALRLILVAYGIGGWVREYKFSRCVGRNVANLATFLAVLWMVLGLLIVGGVIVEELRR